MKESYKSLVAFLVLMAVLIAGTFFLKSINSQLLWYLTRASAITSYVMLFLLTMSGMGITSGFIYNFFGPVFSWRMHRMYGITLVAFVFLHIITLLFDATMKFSLADIFVPFYSQFSPLSMSLGIMGFYLFLLLTITSIVLVVKKYKAWRFIHYLAYPAFLSLFLHGILIGTDTQHPLMTALYWITGVFVAIGLLYRLKKALLQRQVPAKGS